MYSDSYGLNIHIFRGFIMAEPPAPKRGAKKKVLGNDETSFGYWYLFLSITYVVLVLNILGKLQTMIESTCLPPPSCLIPIAMCRAMGRSSWCLSKLIEVLSLSLFTTSTFIRSIFIGSRAVK